MHYGKAINSLRQIIKYRSQSPNFFNSSFLVNSTGGFRLCNYSCNYKSSRNRAKLELYLSWLSNQSYYRYYEFDFLCLDPSNLSKVEVMLVMWPGKRSINVLCTWHSRHIKITHAKDYTRKIGTYRFKLDFGHYRSTIFDKFYIWNLSCRFLFICHAVFWWFQPPWELFRSKLWPVINPRDYFVLLLGPFSLMRPRSRIRWMIFCKIIHIPLQ